MLYLYSRLSLCLQVGLWLVGLQLEEYTSEFSKEGIDGKRLLAIDNSKLKVCDFKKAA